MNTAGLTVEPLINHTSFEAALKGLNIPGDSPVWKELKPVYDVLLPRLNYSAESYRQFLAILLATFYPGIPSEEAYFDLGKKCFHGYATATIIGRVALAAINLMPPDWLMNKTERLWNDTGLGTATVEKLGDKKYHVSYRDFISPPMLVCGVAVEGMQSTKAKNLTYELKLLAPAKPLSSNFDITFQWE
ncbi:MAG TPA: DUF2378 family protein [Chloroflexia bacterium]|nr:DUF2378 family protein [Chloroflexia bacterium]